MAQLSMDIDKWKAEYPFLKNSWANYEEFEKPVKEDEYPGMFYWSTCQFIIMSTVKNTIKYQDFCKKLIRNLGAHSTNPKIINPSSERCKNIQSWLYYLIMKYNIPNNFIEKCFEESKPPKGVGVNNQFCTYSPYKKFINVADDMLKLTIFVDNISTILVILQNKTHEYNCLGRKFLYECFNIYKNLNEEYCSNGRTNDTMNICSKLDTFKSYYGPYISTLSNIPEEIKTLNAEGIQFTDVCPLNKSKPESLPDQVHSTGSAGSSSTATALGTVAGVSSVLALLYKLTPAGRWINLGLRGGRSGINNNLYDDEGNEMLFDGNVNSEFNSYNIGYEAA